MNPSLLKQEDIVDLVADSFLYHLRHLGGEVGLEKLKLEIKEMDV